MAKNSGGPFRRTKKCIKGEKRKNILKTLRRKSLSKITSSDSLIQGLQSLHDKTKSRLPGEERVTPQWSTTSLLANVLQQTTLAGQTVWLKNNSISTRKKYKNAEPLVLETCLYKTNAHIDICFDGAK